MVGESINTFWDRDTQPNSILTLSPDSKGELLVAEIIDPSANADSTFFSIWANISRNSGIWYWECVADVATGDAERKMFFGIGIAKNDGSGDVPDVSGTYVTNGIKQNNTVYRSDGIIENGGLIRFDFSESLEPVTISILLNFDTSILTISIDGLNRLVTSFPPGDYFPYLSVQRGKITANFGDLPFNEKIPAEARSYNCPPSDVMPNVIWDRSSQPDPIMKLLPDVNGDLLIAEVDEITANSSSDFFSIWATVPKMTGKWYWEYTVDVSSSDPNRFIHMAAGIARNDGGIFVPDIIGTFDANGIKETKTVYRTNGETLKNGASGLVNTSNLLEPFIMSFLLDMDNHTLDIKINNISIINNQFVNDALATTEYFPYIALQRGKIEANFGSKTLAFGTPTGFQRYRSPTQSFDFFIPGSPNDTGLKNIFEVANTVVPVFSDMTLESINTYTNFVNTFTTACNTDDNKISTFIVPQPRTSGRLSG